MGEKIMESLCFLILFQILLVVYNKNSIIGGGGSFRQILSGFPEIMQVAMFIILQFSAFDAFLALKSTAPDIRRHKDGMMLSQSPRDILVERQYVSDTISRRSNQSVI